MGSSEGACGPWGKVVCRGPAPLIPALFGLWLPPAHPARVSCRVLGRSRYFGYKALLMYVEVLPLLPRCCLSQILPGGEEAHVPVPSPRVGSAHGASV